jgi:hypothetical protein
MPYGTSPVLERVGARYHPGRENAEVTIMIDSASLLALVRSAALTTQPRPARARRPMSVSRLLLLSIVGFVSAAALVAAPVSAQDDTDDGSAASPSASESSDFLDEIEVRGRRMSEIDFNLHRYVQDFVLEVTAPPRGRGFARWRNRVCIGVTNLESSAAQYLVDRISAVAMDIGLDPGEPGCTPQVMIIFTTDASELATRLVERDQRLFRPGGGISGMNLSLDALDRFKESERAVRWWHVSLPVDARTGRPAIRLPGDDVPWISVAGPSRIYSGVRDDLQRVIVIVDATKLAGTTWQQLGDYLAVVALAQVDPNTNPAQFDSILNLFNTPQYYSGLTDWDWSFLRGLYSFDQERMPQLQRGGLVSAIVRLEREEADRARAGED